MNQNWRELELHDITDIHVFVTKGKHIHFTLIVWRISETKIKNDNLKIHVYC